MPSKESTIVSYSKARTNTTAVAWMVDPVSGIVSETAYSLAFTGCCCPAALPASSAANNRLPTVRIHSVQRCFRLGHLLPTRNRLFRGFGHRRRHVGLDLGELLRLQSLFLQVFLVLTDRVAPAPALEQLGGKRLTRFALVMRRMPTHAEC